MQHYKKWQDALLAQKKRGQRAEQQAFTVHNLNHVINIYVPEKPSNTRASLPYLLRSGFDGSAGMGSATSMTTIHACLRRKGRRENSARSTA